ncbi:hypothetical protein [Dictyobacter formicarum]|uniref:Uncharacterized protein n=1 Tax=Dictyobacter formicarum TaxID=2778368 RepID=A0ABQ3VHC5_9CHLR|nr:hypothetical protein [Dictyobacter formicarum]GHO85589.1 hypothetical protein KSZ_35950 [Dictyobacter formicarum]
MSVENQHISEQDIGLVSSIGSVEIDWPRTIGYYGGIGLAVALELIDLPLAIFIGAIPFFKMLNRPQASRPTRFMSQLLEGAAKPVGGDAEATLQLLTDDGAHPRHPTILQEARQLANRRWEQSKALPTRQTIS